MQKTKLKLLEWSLVINAVIIIVLTLFISAIGQYTNYQVIMPLISVELLCVIQLGLLLKIIIPEWKKL